MERDTHGRFKKGVTGFWKGKKRLKQTGKSNPRWSGGGHEVICEHCKKVYCVPKYRLNKTKFCSFSCAAKVKFTGEKNVKWKGGISNWKDSVKNTKEYKDWRLKVFQRDWFSCRKCNYRSGTNKSRNRKTSDIHAHHIIPMRDDQEKWFEITNGITLCISCHRETYGVEEKYAKEFNEILNDYMLNNPKG